MTTRSEDILICNELVDDLNAREWSEAFYTERTYAADWHLDKELSELQVGVWPGESNAEPFERDLLLKTYQIGFTFGKKVAAATTDDIDRLMEVVKEVQEYYELSQVTIAPSPDHPDGIGFVNTGWDYVLRFNELTLDRNKGTDGIVKYTGLFASILTFDFRSLE